MLEVRDLDLKYGQSQILFGVNLDARPGEISGVMGNNGVGKSSLLKAISGRHPMTGGRVSIDGQEIELRSAFHAAQAGIAYVPQGREIFPMLSVLENLETGFACLDKQDRGVPEHIFALFPVLKDMQHRRGGDLSGGQQQQLAIARALIMRPKVLLLDEPTEGIQPNVIQQIGDALVTLKDTGDLVIVLVEQNIDFGYRTCDRFTIMEQGRVKRVAEKGTYEKAMLAQDLAL